MDLLKKELERKKRTMQSVKEQLSTGSGGNRFLRQSELRRLEEELTEQEKRNKVAAQHESQPTSTSLKRQRTDPGGTTADGGGSRSHPGGSSTDKTGAEPRKARGTKQTTASDSVDKQEFLHPSEITNRLRMLGLPVRLFGERTVRVDHNEDCQAYDDSARLERLRDAALLQRETLVSLSEKDEFRLGQGHGIRNPFLDKARTQATGGAHAASSDAAASHVQDENYDQDDDDINDPHKRIYKYFKGLLRQWEDDLTKRPDEVKQGVAGQNETKTFKQCKDYIRPLFKLCKTRKLEEGLVANLALIVDFCQQGEFVQAHDAYMDVAIGRSAWPIGVTMVGIHARTGRAKIESKNVAHVMNSELQRKYLTSVKRLMTYAQSKRPDVDPSKKVIN